MVAAATVLPPLPAPDEAILTRLFETSAPSLTDLFQSLTQSRIDGAPQSLLDLCRWSQRPDIRAWLDFHDSELSAAIRRRRIAKLEEIADASQDLVEQRRACTTILRHLTQPFAHRVTIHNRAGASPPSFPPDKFPGDSLNGSMHRPGPQGHQSIGRGNAPAPAATSHTTPQGSKQSSPNQPQASAAPAHPHSASPDHPSNSRPSPHPPISQSPHPLPDSLLELAVSHVQTPRDPVSIAALAGALAPTATINSSPFDPLAPELALATLPIPPSTLTDIGPPTIDSTDDTITWSSTFTYSTGARSRFRLRLARINSRWLIASLDHQLNTS